MPAPARNAEPLDAGSLVIEPGSAPPADAALGDAALGESAPSDASAGDAAPSDGSLPDAARPDASPIDAAADAAPDAAPDAGSSPSFPYSVPCGPNTCNVGDYCCNASCGICKGPGETCSQKPCG